MKSEILDRPPPSAPESEVALLSGLAVAGRVNPDVHIRPDQFYEPRNAAMYSAMIELDGENGGFDLPALLSRLRINRLWNQDGFDGAYVGTVFDSHGAPSMASYHAEEIVKAWQRRIVGNAALDIYRLSNDGFDLDQLEQSLERIKAAADGTDGGYKIGQVVSRTLDSVQSKKLSWLWPNRIPSGKYTEIIGFPGVGKSVLLCDLMARVSRGSPCPDSDVPMGPGGVVLLTCEDDPADTIRPRLDAAGADCSRIRLLESVGAYDSETGKRTFRSISLDRDVPALEEAVKATPDCKLVVVDPITAYCGKTDSHKAAEVRALLVPLTDLASKYNIAVVGITHFNKGNNGPAVGRGMGSLAWVAAARMAWGVVKDEDDPTTRLMLPIKCNLSGDVQGLSYKIVDQDGVPVVAWSKEAVTKTVDDVLSTSQGNRQSPKRRDVKEWLKAKLASGPVPSDEIYKDGEALGYQEGLLKWAKKELNISAYKEGFGSDAKWFWNDLHAH